MRTIVTLLFLLVATPAFAGGSFDGYIEYWYEYPSWTKAIGGSGIKYFRKGDYVELRSPSGTYVRYNVQKLGSQQRYDQRINVHICVNEQCDSEFWRNRLPTTYTTRRTR